MQCLPQSYQLFLEPEWALSQLPIRSSASWAIDLKAMRARERNEKIHQSLNPTALNQRQ